MKHHIAGLHHVTATVSDAQQDLDFYIGVLGLRLVKKTVNFDNNRVFHFYYGNESGTPGTIMTTFPYKGQGVRQGVKGSGQIVVTSFSVPEGSMDFWKSRLKDRGISFTDEGIRMGEPVISFEDPSELKIELIGNKFDNRKPWTTDEIDDSSAIRGFHSVSLSLVQIHPTINLLTEILGFDIDAEEGNRTRLSAGGKGAGHNLDLLEEPQRPRGINGLGTVHHVALAIGSDPEQLQLRTHLLEKGFRVTPVMDRNYFHSIYFREPGGVLLEVATIPPGFLIDEPLELLGQDLKLPEWEEPNRPVIEAGLDKIIY